MHWSFWLATLLAFGFLLTNYVAPFLVRRFSSNIRITSIGLRSIRGLFLKFSNITVNVDRIALTVHRSTGGFRIGFEVYSVVVNVAKTKKDPIPRSRRNGWQGIRERVQENRRRGFSIASVAGLLQHSSGPDKRPLTKRFLDALTNAARAVARVASVFALSLFIRCLPALTQNFDIHFDHITVVSEVLGGVHVVSKGVTLATMAKFTKQDPEAKESDCDGGDVVTVKEEEKEVARMRRFRMGIERKWKDSVGRVWELSTARTNGFASFALDVEEIIVYPLNNSPQTPRAKFGTFNLGLSMKSLKRSQTQEERHMPPDAFVFIQGPANLKASVGFSPQRMVFKRQSGELLLNVPSVSIAADKLLSSLERPEGEADGDESSDSGGGRHSVTSSISSVSPWSPITRSFSPPGSPKIEPINPAIRWTQSRLTKRRPQKTMPQVIFAVLKGIMVDVPNIQVNHSSVGDVPGSYSASVKGLLLRLQLSEPSTSLVHQRFLGASNLMDSRKDLGVYSFTFHTKSAKVDRLDDRDRVLSKMVQLREIDVEFLFTRWPTPWFVPPAFLADDPNAALVVVQGDIDKLELSEQASIIHKLLDLVPRRPRRELDPPGHIIYPIPRLIIDTRIASISAQLIHGQSPSLDDSYPVIEAQTDGLEIHFTSSFRDCITSAPALQLPIPDDQMSVQMDYNFMISLDPFSAWTAEEAPPSEPILDEDQSWSMSPFGPTPVSSFASLPNLRTPFFHTGRLEIVGNGSAFGFHGSKISPGVSMDGTTFYTDVQVVPEDIVIDLSDPEVIEGLAHALADYTIASTPKIRPASKPIFESLPSGLSVHIAFPSVRFGVAGRGVRPDESENINRGIALKTAVGISYSHLLAHHTQRVRQQRPGLAKRDRLGLGGDSIQEAMAHVGDSNFGEGSTAVIHYSIRDTSLRCLVGSEDYGWRSSEVQDPPFTAGDDVDAHLMLRIPEIAGDVLFRRRQRNITIEALRVSDSCRVHVRICRMASRIDLHHIYCVFTAVAALQSLSPPRTQPRSRQLPHQVMSLDVHVQSDNLQLVLVLPAKKIFLRAMAIKYNLNPHLTHTVNIKNITGWVPSPSFDDKWEELARLNSWNIVIQPRSALGAGVMVEAMGKGARLRIPYKFIFSDLVTDVAVSIKATKHLATTSFAKQFVPMAKPPVEDAKRVPLINLHVECLIVEAADDPFESRLNMIWRAGLVEHRARIERDQAFSAKVEAIKAAEEGRQSSEVMTSDGRQGGVSPAHSISIQEAKDRLGLYNAQRWVQVHKLARDKLIAHEESVAYRIRDPAAALVQYTMPPFEVYTERASPPVIRVVLDNVGLHLKQAQFEDSTFADFMNELGGIPRETEYTLLIPLHLTWAMDSAQITIRDYPLPLLSITGCEKAWECSTNLVIAEEVGGDATVDWIPCRISSPTVSGHQDTFSFFVPKTVNPVKTYADPRVTVRTTEVTDIAWGVSYNPPLQDVMRVIDTLSTAPRDKSPSIGFWDKLRLVLHWKVLIEFDGEVHVHLKGSRDPYQISGTGAGFVLCFDGNTKLTVGHSWQDRELIQLSSDRTLLAIPDLKHFEEGSSASSVDQESLKLSPANPFSRSKRKLAKICAKLTNGVRLGLGFILERTCGPECRMCRGKSAFSKRCRFFNFKPHYKVELSATPPWESAIRLLDSYAGFRSDFIHFSLSLTSPTSPDNSWKDAEGRPLGYNIFHLTPKAFSHFFAWWELFNGAVSLPIRQGKRWPSARPLSPKFGRHLATIKYRFSLSPLFISHTYKQDLKEQWREGETGAVGIKVMAETFKADLHQREQEIHVIDPVTGLLKKTTHKPFYAAEVSLTNIEARAVSALFSDPRKALVPLFQAKHENFESQPAGPTFPEKSCLDLSSKWFDIDDFSETDWVPTDRNPRVWMFQAAHCPRFTFFRSLTVPRPSGTTDEGEAEVSKFGQEDTHICLLSKEDTVRSVQIDLAGKRIKELKQELDQIYLAMMDKRGAQSTWSGNSTDTTHTDDPSAQKAERIQRSMDRLETYIESLSAPRTKRPAKQPAFSGCAPFDAMPRDSFSSVMSLEDWSEFTNVYEVHSPTVILSNSTRNILLTYYYSSRNRRAFEYHMSARAVKFIREQAKTELRRSMESTTSSNNEPSKVQSAAARAANTLLKMLIYEGSEEKHEKHEKHERQDSVPSVEQSSLASNLVPKKSHFCLLMKPQIALHCEEGEDAVVFLAAMEASWQSHAILDMEYIDDPVNGYIMSRNNVKLRGLQAFVPVELGSVSSFDQVPLEVLVDYKCESAEYERLVPHTDASILYDKFNRLRLHSKVSSNTSGPLLDTDSSNEHLKYQADRIIVDIPRFAITANSKSFNSLQTIITHLLLYTDPIHALRNEALEEFLFTYDSFSDFSSAAEVVSTLQGRIRNLMRISNKYDLIFDQLSESGQMDALTANAHLTALSDELAFIFEAIRLAQEKARNFDDDLSSALRLDVKSDLISWNMLGPYSDLLAKLTVKNTSFTWTNRKDCTTTNQLIIGDLQALNGSPDTAFPEILTAYPHPSSHPMVKKKLFATAEWIVLPPVGQISIVEKLEIKMHPVKVQIERKVGREIQEYISPKAKRVKAGDNHRPAHHHHHAHHHTLSHGSTKGDSTSTSTSQHLSSSIDTFGTSSQATIPSSVPASMENSLSLSVPSIDHSPVNLASPHEGTFQQPRSLSRARSKSSNNLREEAQGGSLVASTGALPITGVDSSARTATRGLRRAKSSTNLASRSGTGDDSGTDSVVGPVTFAPGTNDAPASSGAAAHSHAVGYKKPKPQRLTSETAEMRARAQKRTFISVELHGFLIVLTYKGEPLNLGRRGDQGGIRARDLVPDVQDFQLAFPKFEHKNCTWSVEEFLADVKSELMKNAFGMVFKAFNARLTAKYRHNDPGQTPAIRFKELDDEDTRHKQSSQSTPPHPPLHRFFSSKHRNPAPTPQPPPQPSFDTKNSPSKSKSTSRGSGDSSAPSSWSNAILSETEVLTSSPTSKKVPLPRLDPSETSLGSTSTTGGSEKPRGRVLRKLFRRPHSHRESTDSSTSNISSGAPRTSLDVPGDTLRNETTSRSRSTVR